MTNLQLLKMYLTEQPKDEWDNISPSYYEVLLKKIFILIYFWLHQILVAAHRFFMWFTGFSLVVVRKLDCPTRDQTQVPYIGRWIPNLWTTRDIPMRCLKESNYWNTYNLEGLIESL